MYSRNASILPVHRRYCRTPETLTQMARRVPLVGEEGRGESRVLGHGAACLGAGFPARHSAVQVPPKMDAQMDLFIILIFFRSEGVKHRRNPYNARLENRRFISMVGGLFLLDYTIAIRLCSKHPK